MDSFKTFLICMKVRPKIDSVKMDYSDYFTFDISIKYKTGYTIIL